MKVAVPRTGLPVNLFVGQTGSGKTSLVQMMAGGDPTTTSTFSDTKDCSLYKVVNEGKEFVFLDTPGLLGTASTNDARKASISELAQFIKDNRLNVGRVFYTVAMGERQMAEMPYWNTALLEALSCREQVGPLAYWVITKWNQDSKFNTQRCAKDRADEERGTFPTLSKHELGFGCITHGVDNQEDLFKTMVAT